MGGSVTDYAGNHVYEDGNLQFFNHPEGYVTPDGGGGYNYVYQYKDHLGNARLSYVNNNGTTEIVEESNYYPFGLKHKGYNEGVSPLGNDVAQKWKFGGKEYDESLGLETYDFGARNYDPSLGRWMNIDLLAELGRPNTPFNYAFNNPLYFVDPDGKWSISFQRKGRTRPGRGASNDGNFSFKLNTLNQLDYETADILSHAPLVGGFAEAYKAQVGFSTNNGNVGRSALLNIGFSASGGKLVSKGLKTVGLDFESIKTYSNVLVEEAGGSLIENSQEVSTEEALFVDSEVERGFRLLGFTDKNNNFNQEIIDELKSNIADQLNLDLSNKKDARKLQKRVKLHLEQVGRGIEIYARAAFKRTHEEQSKKRNEEKRKKRQERRR